MIARPFLGFVLIFLGSCGSSVENQSMPDVYTDDAISSVEKRLPENDGIAFSRYVDLKKSNSACLPTGDAVLVKDAIARGKIGIANEQIAERTYYSTAKMLWGDAQKHPDVSEVTQRAIAYDRAQSKILACEKNPFE